MNKEVLRGLGLSMVHGKLGGSRDMLSQEIFEKKDALKSILVHFWPCITCIIYQYQVLVSKANVHVYPY